MILSTLLSAVRSRFARDSGVYLVGSVLSAVMPLAVVPILTRHLTPTDYGIVGTGTTLIQILTLVIGFNSSGLIVSSHYNEEGAVLKQLVTTLLAVAGLLTLALGLVVLAAPGVFERVTLFPGTWAVLLVLLSFAALIQNTYLVLLQARHKAATYVAIQAASSAINLGLSIVLVVGLGMDWRGRLIAQMVAAVVIAAAALLGLIYGLGAVGKKTSRPAFGQLLAFGIPLIPHTAGGWMMAIAPRLYLNHMASLAATGLYSLGVNLASPISLLVGALNQAYMPALFERLRSRDTLDEIRFCRILILGAVAIGAIGIAWSFVASVILRVFVGPRFYDAVTYLFWLALAAALQGIYFIFANFVVFARQTKLIAWRADFIGGLSIITVAPLLIRLSGPVGAAQALCVAQAISTIGAFVAANKAVPMPWRAAFHSMFSPPSNAAPAPASVPVASSAPQPIKEQ